MCEFNNVRTEADFSHVSGGKVKCKDKINGILIRNVMLFKPKNPPYGRHQLSRTMQIVGPIQI